MADDKESLSVYWQEGFRLVVEARKHRLDSDQPVEDGGEDHGMTPTEMFVGSLGACIAYFAVRFFQRHRLSPKGFRMTIAWDYAERPHRIGSIEAELACPLEMDPAMKERLMRVLEGCTVHQTIVHPPKIDIRWRAI
jgi:putative redox protein